MPQPSQSVPIISPPQPEKVNNSVKHFKNFCDLTLSLSFGYAVSDKYGEQMSEAPRRKSKDELD